MPTLREVVSQVQEARKGFMSKTIYSTTASLIGSETAVTSDGSHVLRERGLSYCL